MHDEFRNGAEELACQGRHRGCTGREWIDGDIVEVV